MLYVMNDYELIYLIRHEQDDLALTFMFKKYHKFIWKHVHLLHLESKEIDDFHQEGILMLFKAIQTFDPERNKSFTRYFELIMRRQFYHMKQRLPQYMLFDHTDFVKTPCYIEEEPCMLELSSDMENQVYHDYFLSRKTVSKIHIETGYSKKQIYNTVYRIKEKYKIMI
jgi:RNA polymerase sporulation-specific sigma factor